MSVSLFVCLSIRLFVRLSICLFPSFYLLLYPAVCVCLFLCVRSLICKCYLALSLWTVNGYSKLLTYYSYKGLNVEKNLLNMEILNHLNDCLVKSSRKNIQMSIYYLYSPMDNTNNFKMYTLVSLNDNPLRTLSYLVTKCYATSSKLNSTLVIQMKVFNF